MTLNEFVTNIQQAKLSLDFKGYLQQIEQYFDYTPTAFRNGDVENLAGKNEGSCKLLYFGMMMQLDEVQLLSCFAEHYQHVLATPSGQDHQNIRQFMRSGWQGVSFTGQALQVKAQ